MTAPTTPPQPSNELRVIPIAMLDESRTNPRKRFNQAKLEELGASIKAQGVLQPLLVREITWTVSPPKSNWPFPTPGIAKAEQSAEPSGRYEIIAGARRFRGSKIAGLNEVPCFVRNLTDAQVLHAQVIENLQRDDLHPLEEAEGYESLLKQHVGGSDSVKRANVDKIAAEVGVSRATIYARLKLLDLCHEAREAFFEGKLQIDIALRIARIPVHKLQLQAMKAITKPQDYSTGMLAKGDMMSVRAATELIRRDFMTDLDRAPFPTKDAKLLKGTVSCDMCPERTGNQPELFDDVDSKNVCTNPSCFAMKKAAHLLAIREEAEARGDTVIAGKDAKKILPNQWNPVDFQLKNAGYVALSDKIPGDEKGRTWEQALKEKKLLANVPGGAPVQRTVIENPHKPGVMLQTVSIEQATQQLRQAGFEITMKGASGNANNKAKNDKEDAKIKLAVEQERAFRQRLFADLRTSIMDSTAPGQSAKPGLYALLAEAALEAFWDNNGVDECAKFIQLYMPGVILNQDNANDTWNIFMNGVPALPAQKHFMIMLDCLMMQDEIDNVGECTIRNKTQPKIMNRLAEIEGIDTAAIKQKVIAETKAAAKPKKPAAEPISTPPKAAPAAKKAATKKPTQAPEVVA